eukprot:scaffold19493_cov42-Cyclotella_meneghiniana.AAC.4
MVSMVADLLCARKQHSNDALARQPISSDTQQLFFENYTSALTRSHQKGIHPFSSTVLIPPCRFSLPTIWRTYHILSYSTPKRRLDSNFQVLIPRPTTHHHLEVGTLFCDLPSQRLAISTADMKNNDKRKLIQWLILLIFISYPSIFISSSSISSSSMTRTNRRVPNHVSEVPPNPIIRPASQPSDVSSLPTHGFIQQPPPADPTSTVEVEDVHSQNTPPCSTDSRAESLFPEQQSVQRRGGHDPPSTAPTPYVDSNGDVQGLSPFFNPRRPEPLTRPPQARDQADDVSAITQQQPQPQDDRLTRTLDQMLDCLNVLLSRSDHLSQRNEHHGVSFARQHAPPTAESRQSLDLPLKTIVYQGTEMTNSPVLLRPGDQAYWKYGNDLMRSVEIIETTLPTVLRRQPIYHIKCGNSQEIIETTLPTVLRRQPIYHIKCGNSQEYDVRHDDLFISRSNAMELDSNSVIRSTSSILSASDQLDLHAIDGPHPSHLSASWAGLNPEKFKLHNLKTHLKDFALDGDSIVSIVNAYEFISQAITAASTTGVVKLPDITELSPDISIRDLFLPPPSYPRYTTAKACYQNIAGSLSILFQLRDFAAKAPKTRPNLLAIRSQDGIDQLNHILRTRIPTLGATDFQPYQSIMELKVEDNMLLITFIKQAIRI